MTVEAYADRLDALRLLCHELEEGVQQALKEKDGLFALYLAAMRMHYGNLLRAWAPLWFTQMLLEGGDPYTNPHFCKHYLNNR